MLPKATDDQTLADWAVVAPDFRIEAENDGFWLYRRQSHDIALGYDDPGIADQFRQGARVGDNDRGFARHRLWRDAAILFLDDRWHDHDVGSAHVSDISAFETDLAA